MSSIEFNATNEFAVAQTVRDPLASFRGRFHIPKKPDGSDCVYLCGQSLGLQPKSVPEYVEQELRDWARLGVDAQLHARYPWIPYHEILSAPISRLVGAIPIEVVAMNSLTVNLHLMMVSFYRPTAQRNKILIEANAFPSDQYAVKSQIQYHGHDPATSLIEIAPRQGETAIRTDDIEKLISAEGETIALVMLGGVNYYSGQAFDFSRITKAGHSKGCVVAFDLAHAIGNIPLQLHHWNVDFAVWCSYKYLNGGPGAIGGCFVHERHARDPELPRFAGWWGHDKENRFLMEPEFRAIPGAEGWQLGNPSILSAAALRASLDIFDEAKMERLRVKSELLTGYLEFLLSQTPSQKFSVITPRDVAHRGAQLSLRLPVNGRAICDALAKEGIVCDWREPDILRVAPVPLYNTFLDVHTFAEIFLKAIRL
ncbi:MAG TPA: kynureninase [Candidatus Acidoferrales bacterium]|nr:kynureninase [Candidatus Acidoferrales bacterium]